MYSSGKLPWETCYVDSTQSGGDVLFESIWRDECKERLNTGAVKRTYQGCIFKNLKRRISGFLSRCRKPDISVGRAAVDISIARAVTISEERTLFKVKKT